MRRLGISTVLTATLLATGAFGGGDAGKKDLERFQGTWKILKMEHGGRAAPADEVQNAQLVIAGDKLTVKLTGKREEPATFTLDPAKKPAAIDIRTGKDGKELVRGIYKFEKDQLVICFAKDDGVRPQAFASTPETRNSLVVLERVKK